MKADNLKIRKMSLIAETAVVSIFVFVLGCSSTEKVIKSPVDLPERFSANGGGALAEKWWESFDDPALNNLVEEAIGNNFSIRSVWDRLRQAEQVAVKAGASLLPEVDYKAIGKRTGQEVSGERAYTTSYTAGLVVSYEVDLWGRVRSSQEAAILDAEAAEMDVFAAGITLSSAVAKTWYGLVEANKRSDVLGKQIETNDDVLKIVTAQFRKGRVGAADVYRQQQLVESTRGKLIQAREEVALFENQLSVLLGRSPGEKYFKDEMEFAELPEFPRLDLLASVIGARPDVVNFYKAIAAADKRVAAAIADQYPTISISSTSETSAGEVGDLFDDWVANLAGNAICPIFDAGLRKAEVARRRAVLSEAINNYGQKLLEAVREAEDAISQESYHRRYVESLGKQLQLARQVYSRTQASYFKGQLDYLRVLESLVSQQNLEISELTSRRLLINRRIDLCKAVSGGWEIKRPREAKIVEQ